jgi:SAM-dependent methyltransferase
MTEGWERLWRDDAVAAHWREADPRVVALADGLAGRRAYDLGCGVGRHAMALAGRGLRVSASDLSPTALGRCRVALAERGLAVGLVQAAMTTAPFADGSFDLVVAYHVLYHGTAAEMARAMGEIRRVLRPGGRLYVTFISANDSKCARMRRQAAAGLAEELEPNTFRRPDRSESDEYLPHHFTSEAELHDRFLAGLEPLEVDERRSVGPDDHETQRHRAHWHVLAQTRA